MIGTPGIESIRGIQARKPYETESGMTDDDALCDTSFNGIGYSLQIEVVDAVVKAARQAATDRRAGDPNGRKLGKPKG